MLDRTTALIYANRVLDTIAPHCEVATLAGSLRRKAQEAKDIDIVVIPSNVNRLVMAIYDLAGTHKLKGSGKHHIPFALKDNIMVRVDVYVATLLTYASTLLIYTGPKEFNIMMIKHAKRLGLSLHADGLKSAVDGVPLEPVVTEAGIFEALRLPYLAPEGRKPS